jgi:hypothetical protein
MNVNWGSWILWGFVSTVVLTTIEAGSQGLNLTRMNMPYMVGTMFTPNRDAAKVYGSLLHFLNGWALSLVYVAAFQAWGQATWWLGVLIGIVHALFLLTVVMSLLPSMHPRMASEQAGPTARRQLEPPGFLGLNYGFRTPLSVLLSHVAFGTILGAFYQLARR